jgi:uncharacterized OB-fold protein
MEVSEETFFTPAVPMDFVYNYRVGTYIERFLQGFKERKILGSKCPGCARVAVPPRMWCGVCNKKMEELVELSQEGTLENFTVGHIILEKGRIEPADTPQIIGLVKLNGASSSLLARVEGVPAAAVKTGMRLKAAWKDEVEGDYADLDHFEPV